MELNLSELISKKEKVKNIDVTFNIDLKGEDFEISKPLTFKGEIKCSSDILTVIGNVEGSVKMQCSRCLKIFSHNINLNICEEFTNNSDKEDDSITFFEGDLYLSEVIVNNVISTLPIKKLCKKDCKGLCHECGTDLNLGTCNCNNNDIDIRMAKLMDLFKE
ncbi:MAG: YceD family protein [Clostridium perfringens]|nr:YceD family protein [Clostridium perfringens]